MAFGMSWDPFRDFERMERMIRRNLEGLGGRFAEISSPPVELTDEGDHYLVTAELPGVSEKDVDITLSGNVLTIRGEKRYEKKTEPAKTGGGAKGGARTDDQKRAGEKAELAKTEESETALTRPMYSELFYGRFERVLTLPDDIDPEHIDAEYRDGVLHLTVGKKKGQSARRINITKH